MRSLGDGGEISPTGMHGDAPPCQVIAIAGEFNVDARIVGRVEAAPASQGEGGYLTNGCLTNVVTSQSIFYPHLNSGGVIGNGGG